METSKNSEYPTFISFHQMRTINRHRPAWSQFLDFRGLDLKMRTGPNNQTNIFQYQMLFFPIRSYFPRPGYASNAALCNMLRFSEKGHDNWASDQLPKAAFCTLIAGLITPINRIVSRALHRRGWGFSGWCFINTLNKIHARRHRPPRRRQMAGRRH